VHLQAGNTSAGRPAAQAAGYGIYLDIKILIHTGVAVRETITAEFEVLDDRFRAVHGDRQLEMLHTGCRWTEGPAYFPAGRYLVFSDIPNDRLLRWDETTGTVGVFRQPSRFSNGHTVDRRGRLVSCEHGGR